MMQEFDDGVIWVEPDPPEPVKRKTAAMRRWREANRVRATQQSIVANHRTKARRAGQNPTLTFAQWWTLLEEIGWRCLACGVLTEFLTLDHIKPRIRGGRTTLDNVQPLCAWCNKSKGTKIIDYREKAA